MKTLRNLLFVINPVSGGVNKARFIRSLKALSLKHQFFYTVVETKGMDDLQLISQAVATHQPDCVVAAGGDGTCNLVVKAVRGTSLHMGIVPLGSANGMATELAIPFEPEEAIKHILKGRERLIDVLMINDQFPCIHFSDMGLNAKIVKGFHEDNTRGFFSYARHLLKEIRRSRPDDFELKLDKFNIKRKAHMIAFANAKKYGTGAVLNQKGKIDDGMFEVVMVKSFTIFTIIEVLLSIFTSVVYASKHIEIIRTKYAWVYCRHPQLLQIDGEMVGTYKHVKVNIMPGDLKLLC